MNTIELNHSAVASVQRGGHEIPALSLEPVEHGVLATGKFVVEHYRDGKRINEYHFPNGITNQGKNALLDIMFHGSTQITTWYLGLIDSTGYTALAAGDTYANINGSNGWDEFTDYTDTNNAASGTTRPVWTEGAASGQSITNGTVVPYLITGTGTVKGLFVVGGGTDAMDKSDAAGGGTLWATALFTNGDVPVLASDVLRVTYTVNA